MLECAHSGSRTHSSFVGIYSRNVPVVLVVRVGLLLRLLLHDRLLARLLERGDALPRDKEVERVGWVVLGAVGPHARERLPVLGLRVVDEGDTPDQQAGQAEGIGAEVTA